MMVLTEVPLSLAGQRVVIELVVMRERRVDRAAGNDDCAVGVRTTNEFGERARGRQHELGGRALGEANTLNTLNTLSCSMPRRPA